MLSEVTFEAPDPSAPAHMCWRHDNQYLALSTCDASTSQRNLRVWTQDLTLHGVGRHEDNTNVANLRPGLTWNPDGSIIAIPQTVRDKLQIVFFERNGLRHREFLIPHFDPAVTNVDTLAWNSRGDVLAVVVSIEREGSSSSFLQLWYRENYHWYLKTQLPFDSISSDGNDSITHKLITSIEWDPENVYRLRLSTAESYRPMRMLHRLQFEWHYCVSKGSQSIAAVIDGDKLKLTSFKHALVAPPECYASIRFPNPISHACFEPTQLQRTPGQSDSAALPITGDNRIAVITTDGDLCVSVSCVNSPRSRMARKGKLICYVRDNDGIPWYEEGVPSSFEQSIISKSMQKWAGQVKLKLGHISDISCIRCFRWVSAHVYQKEGEELLAEYVFLLIVCKDDVRTHYDELQILSLTLSSSGDRNFSLRTLESPTCGRIVQICRDQSLQKGHFIQLSDGSVYQLDVDQGTLSWRLQLPEVATTMVTLPKPILYCSESPHKRTLSESMGMDDALSSNASDMDAAGAEEREEHNTVPTSLLVCLSTHSGNLFLEGKLICPACSSIDVHWVLSRYHDKCQAERDYVYPRLLYSTLGPIPDLCFASRDTLEALYRATTLSDNHASRIFYESILNENNAYDRQGTRPLERGARIVSSLPWTAQVVLQMPRGNLEGIYPRALVLSTIRYLLDTERFHEAVDTMRRHRVDLNLLADNNPSQFVNSLGKMVRQITSHDRWDLFLSTLEDEDVTRTRYPRPPFKNVRTLLDQRSTQVNLIEAWNNNTKRDTICKCVRDAIISEYSAIKSLLNKEDPDGVLDNKVPWKLIFSIVTSYCKETSPSLSEALLLVQRVSILEKEEHKSKVLSQMLADVTADKLLDHLLLLVDSDMLYHEALATYDLELVALVTQKSQKDPKEYLPFLKKLQKLQKRNHLHRNVAIDVYLKHWKRAASNLLNIHRSKTTNEESELETLEKVPTVTISSDTDIETLIENPLVACYRILIDNAMFGEGQRLFASQSRVLYESITVDWGRWLAGKASELIQTQRSEALKTQASGYVMQSVSAKLLEAKKMRQWAVGCFLSVTPRCLEEAVDVCAKYPDFQPGWKIAKALLQEEIEEEKRKEKAWEMSKKLRKSSDREHWRGAAELLRDICQDIETGVLSLCGIEDVTMEADVVGTVNGLYEEAVSLAIVNGRRDLVDTVITQAASNAARSVITSFEERTQIFDKAYDKLTASRKMRMSMPIHELLGVTEAQLEERMNDDGGDDGDSVWSDTSSVAGSVASGVSEASSDSRFTDLSKLSGTSLGSAASGNTRRTDGRFSGISSLELTNNPFSQRGHELDTQEKELQRREKKRHQKKKRKANKEKRVGRPGSSREQAYYEEYLSKSLPSDDEIAQWQELFLNLLLLNCTVEATELKRKFIQMMKHMTNCPELPYRVEFPPKPENASSKLITVTPFPGATPTAIPENLLPDPETTQNADAHPDNCYAWVDDRLRYFRQSPFLLEEFMKPVGNFSLGFE